MRSLRNQDEIVEDMYYLSETNYVRSCNKCRSKTLILIQSWISICTTFIPFFINILLLKNSETILSFLLNMCEIACLEAAPIIYIEITHNLKAVLSINLTQVCSIELCFYLHLTQKL